MKNYRRCERRFTNYNKYKRRVKKFVTDWDLVYFAKDKGIKHPTWKDIINYNAATLYKHVSTQCSCSSCAYYKYNRLESKKDFKRIMKDEQSEQSD